MADTNVIVICVFSFLAVMMLVGLIRYCSGDTTSNTTAYSLNSRPYTTKYHHPDGISPNVVVVDMSDSSYPDIALTPVPSCPRPRRGPRPRPCPMPVHHDSPSHNDHGSSSWNLAPDWSSAPPDYTSTSTTDYSSSTTDCSPSSGADCSSSSAPTSSD
ncbi:MAG: hypothetical protein J3R72DRAFT_485805 [Linnemannia gamsii]|nr:MAG: hypothetical protein J3R72DRAFT_485805 [Linnemannia gamsii]